MSKCARLFEVEALRDGRLAGAERVSFERHMASCAACAREAQALDALAASVRARANDEQDELGVRRERTRLLAAFDASLVRTEGASRRWVWVALAFVAFVALVAGGLVVVRTRNVTAAARAPAVAPSTVIEADGSALYSTRNEGARERVVLERGALRIQVAHPRASALVVALPDGELEDTGTTFTVKVAEGRTTHVEVEEGSVVLRLRGQPVVVLRAGHTWEPPLTPVVATSTPPAVALPPSASPAPPRSPVAAAEVPSADRDATDALNGEDAAYLRVLALQRAGEQTSMRAAARDYLRRYPSGFRRAEVERLSRPESE